MDRAAQAIDDQALRTSFLEDGVARFLVRHHRWPQCQLLAAIVISTIASIVVIQATRQIVDKAIPAKNPALLAEIATGAFVAVAIKLGANYCVRLLSTYIQNLFTADVRDQLAVHAMNLLNPTLLRGPSGDVHDRIVSGVARFVIGIETILTKPLIATISLLIYGAYLISIDISLMYTLLTLCPALIASPWLNRRLSAKRRERVIAQELYAGQLQETIDAVDEIQAHGTINIERIRLRNDHVAMTKSFMGETVDLALFDLLSGGAAEVAFMAVYVLGGYYAIRGDLSLGILIAFVTAARSFCAAFTDLLGYPPMYRNVADRFEELKMVMLFRAAEDLADAPGQLDLSSYTYDVVKASVVVPPNRIALNEASICIAPGEHVAIVGRSGSGKSTLLNLLAGRMPAVAGTVALGGVALSEWPRQARIAVIGYVRQVPFVFLGSLRDNLLYRARGLADAGTTMALDDARLIEACGWAGLHHDMLDMALEMRGSPSPAWAAELPDLQARFADVEAGRITPDRYIAGVSVLENLTYRPWVSDETPLEDRHVHTLTAKIRACDPMLIDGLVALGRATAQREFEIMRTEESALHGGSAHYSMRAADRTLIRNVINGTGARQITASIRLAFTAVEPIEQGLQSRIVAARRMLGTAISFPPDPPFDAGWSARLTVLENIMGLRLPGGQDHLRDTFKARLIALSDENPSWRGRLLALALGCELAEEGLNLSGGQREKITLARVLVTRPPILLLDEISASLDHASAELVQRTLRDHFSTTSIIAIMHDLDAARWYDRIVVVGDGHVIEDLPLGANPTETIARVRRLLDTNEQDGSFEPQAP